MSEADRRGLGTFVGFASAALALIVSAWINRVPIVLGLLYSLPAGLLGLTVTVIGVKSRALTRRTLVGLGILSLALAAVLFKLGSWYWSTRYHRVAAQAMSLEEQQRYAGSVERWKKAMRLARDHGLPTRAVIAECQVSFNSLIVSGEPAIIDEAFATANGCLDASLEAGNQLMTARAYSVLAHYHSLRDPQSARVAFKKAAELYQGLARPDLEAMTYCDRAELEEIDGKFDRAEDLAKKGLDFFDVAVSPAPESGYSGSARCSQVLARALAEKGQLPAAKERLEQALQLSTRAGDSTNALNTELDLGLLHDRLAYRAVEAGSCQLADSELTLSESHYRRAYNSLVLRPSYLGQAPALEGLGGIESARGHDERARAYFEKALAVSKLPNPERALILSDLALKDAQVCRFGGVGDRVREASAIFRAWGRATVAQFLNEKVDALRRVCDSHQLPSILTYASACGHQ